MTRVKISTHFYADEFLHPNETDISKIDNKLILVAEWLRNQLGKPVVINNYATGGQYKESGLRDPNTSTGAKKSAHKIGKAIDIKVVGMTAKEVFDFCLANELQLYAMGVREIEDHAYTPTWVHLGTRGNWDRIKIIRP